MRRPTLLCLVLCTLCPALAVFSAIQTNLYVSPSGSGSAFSPSQPGNLYAAVGVVRTLNTNMTGDIVVNLYGGTYQLTNSLELAQNGATNDSGTGGFNVIYQAYPGQVPIISGGTNVTGWTLYNAATNIWSAFVGTGVNSRQLYVNGVRAVRARGPLNPSGFGLNSGGTGFTTTNLAMQSWGNPTNMEIVQRHNWKQLRCPIASISGTNIVMQTPGWTYTGTTPTPGRPWNGNGVVSLTGVTWVENAFELLTSPGMWYLNEATGYLYYIPRPGENMATANVVMPFLEKLVDANGSYPANPIHNIVLSGLTFEYGTWLLPSTGNGYADNQTGIMWSGPTNPLKTLGNVSFQTSSSITVSNCFFEHLGGSGLDFGMGCHTNSVIGNHFEDISADGLSMGEVTDFGATNEDQMTDGNVIQDNYIRRPGQEYEDCIGIWIGYSMNSTVAHNDVDNSPYTGISLGWGWGTSSYAANNFVESNYVGKVMQTLTDGGSVYSLSEQSNSWHIGNYYKDSCYQDIYLDEGSAYWTIVSNVFDDCAHNYVNLNSSSTNTTGGLENNHNNTATNNFSNTTAASSPSSKSTNDVISNTVIVVQQNWPAPAQAYIESAGLEPAYAQIPLPTGTINDNDSNCVYHGAWTYSTGRTFGDYDADAHVSTTAGDYVDCYFYGTGAGAVCEKNSNAGNVDVYLDGVYQATESCVAASLLPQQTIFSVSNLRPQFHTLRLSNDVPQALVVDAVTVQGAPQFLVNDSEPNFDHVPSDWTYSNTTTRDDYHNDVHQTQVNGQYVQYTFTASGITWLSEMNSNMGAVAVTLDGVSQGTVNCSNATLIAQAPMFSATNLAAGPHTLQLTKNSGSYMMVDAFAVVPVDYWLTATTNAFSMTGSNVVSSVIKINTYENFSGSVALSVSGLPSGDTYGFNPPTITGAGFSTLTITNGAATAPGNDELTIHGVNGTLTNIATIGFVIVNPTAGFLAWNGGGAPIGNWSDAANWNGTNIAANDSLLFGGTTGFNNTNDTAAGTMYSNIALGFGAGAFVLNGNPITLSQAIFNESSNPQTIEPVVNFNSTITLTGGNSPAAPLIIGGGLNETGNATTTYLSGYGVLSNNLTAANTNGSGTNVITMSNNSANWTLADNATSSTITLPWGFVIFGGTLNFGTGNDITGPNFVSTPGNAQLNGDDFFLGDGAGLVGTLNMVNGSLTLHARLDTGTVVSGSTGIVNQTGGTLTIDGQFQGANIGGGASTVTLSGGTFNVVGNTTFVASRGTGSFTVGGSAVANLGLLDVSRGIGLPTVGVVDLNAGGTLVASQISTATANAASPVTGASANFNFNGGVLKASAASASFIRDSSEGNVTIPLSVTVQSGGAIINDNGFAISCLEVLQHDSTLGSTNDGGLTKLGGGTLTLADANTYTGPTTISNGTLALGSAGSISDSVAINIASGATLNASPRTDSTLTLTAGQTLTGTGTNTGNLVEGSGSTVAPGSPGVIGTLTVSGGAGLQGTTSTKLNATGATNDVLSVGSGLGYGGTLSLTNLSGALSANQSYKLFNAASSSNSFSAILPAIPRAGLVWNTSSLDSSGILKIGTGATPRPPIGISRSGTNVILSGATSLAGVTYYLLSSTNITTPLSSWTRVATNTFDNTGHFSITSPLNTDGGIYFTLQVP